MTATSTEQRTANSCAFLNRPPFRFRNVLRQILALIGHKYASSAYTERLRSSLMALISIFLRPILIYSPNARDRIGKGVASSGTASFTTSTGDSKLLENKGLYATAQHGHVAELCVKYCAMPQVSECSRAMSKTRGRSPLKQKQRKE